MYYCLEIASYIDFQFYNSSQMHIAKEVKSLKTLVKLFKSLNLSSANTLKKLDVSER